MVWCVDPIKANSQLCLSVSNFLLALLSGLVAGYIHFHNQAELAPFWASISPFSSLLLGVLIPIGIRLTPASNAFRLIACGLLGGLLAYALAGPEAAERIQQQVSPECHNTPIKGFFLLQDVSLQPDQQNKLIFKNLHTMPCLVENARLQAIYANQSWKIGGTYVLEGDLKAPRGKLQLNGFDVEAYWMSKHISGMIKLQSHPLLTQPADRFNTLQSLKQLRLNTSNWLLQVNGKSPSFGLLLALVTGDQGLLTSEERQLYSETGIAHLVAISGLHITLLALIAGRIFSFLWRQSATCIRFCSPQLIGPLVGLSFALAYAIASGWAVPAQRTIWMIGVLFIYQLAGLSISAWNVWALALLIVLMLDPWAIKDVGCLLSFGAVAILIYAHSSEKLLKTPSFSGLREAVKGQYAITIGLMPITWVVFNQQSLVSPLVNALSIPWMSFISTPTAILGALSRQDWLIYMADYSLQIQNHWLSWFGTLKWASVPVAQPDGWVILLICLGCVILISPRGLFPRWLGVLLVLTTLINTSTPEYGHAIVDVHDVGQGSAITIRTKNHTLLFDTGPASSSGSNSGKRVLQPFFQHLGIRHLDALWISHDDSDHTGGATYLIDSMKIKTLASSVPHQLSILKQVRNHDMTISNCHTMAPWTWDGVLFEPIRVNRKLFSNDNNSSCLLKVSTQGSSILLTGDIQRQVENWLVDNKPDLLISTILVVPHHGSNTSSSRGFIHQVKPQIAIVQSGWKNHFNHPHPEVVSRYLTAGTTLLSTAQLGALQLQIGPDPGISTLYCSRFTLKRYWRLHERGASLQSNCDF